MNIAFNCDNNYAPYLAVVINSILKARINISLSIHFYILSDNIYLSSINYITHLVIKNKCNINFIPVNTEFDDFTITVDYISKVTYARLKLADYLKNVNKVIYLDIDILVLEDLENLWNTNLENKTIGACYDPFIEEFNEHYKLDIGLKPTHYYFNAGVLLINLARWRKHNVFQRSVEIINRVQNIKYQDQDILNFIFENDVKYLDCRYNFTRNHRERIKNHNQVKATETTTMPIAIFHYVGSAKPWLAKFSISKSSLFYEKYLSLQNKPSHWKIEKVSYLKHLNRMRKEIIDKYLYKIY